MDKEFYHTTIKYETYLDDDKEKINKEFIETLINNINRYHKLDYIRKDSLNLKKPSINISITSIDGLVPGYSGSVTSFELSGDITNRQNEPLGFSAGRFYIDNLELQAKLSSGGFTLDNEIGIMTWVYTYPVSEYSSIFPFRAEDIFQSEKLAKDTIVKKYPPSVFIPQKLIERINAYYSALKGFPSPWYSTRNFDRMLYLSAMVITTTGPGDILPISRKARLLVTLESILGIIIIGIFLNSLASRIISRKS